jgi:futalosine hydrolase
LKKRRSKRLLILVPTPREAELLFGASAAIPRARGAANVQIGLIGVGLAAAGAAASRWFARVRPDAALLIGIAGTLAPRKLPVGALLIATRVSCDGIGADEGARFVSFAGPAMELSAPRPARAVRGEVVSVASAAGSRAMVAARRRRHPRALAEEMEGFAVAIAAQLARVPLSIVRGVSNVAGDRDHSKWRARAALEACRAAIDVWIESVAS